MPRKRLDLNRIRTTALFVVAVLLLSALLMVEDPALSARTVRSLELPPSLHVAAFPKSWPSTRQQFMMTYDAADGYVVLFGGFIMHNKTQNTNLYYSDTWIFKGDVWTKLSPPTSPPARADAAIAYDAADGYVVMFGGVGPNGLLNDTWIFAGGTWTQLSPAVSPSARQGSAMTYDAADGYVVLYGGDNSTTAFTDTWRFVGGVWSQLTPTKSPGPTILYKHHRFVVTYDANHSYVVGTACNGCGTWKFVGGQWAVIRPGNGVGHAGMTFDPAINLVLAIGGPLPEKCNDATWIWTGNVWKELSVSGTPPCIPYLDATTQMVYDTTDGYAVLFYGMSRETWTFSDDTWSEVV